MRALVSTAHDNRVRLVHDAPEPVPEPHEALVAVSAFSLNRGELALLAGRPAGWRPGQDVAGMVLSPAREGSSPVAGSHVVGLVEEGGWAERVAVPVNRLAALPDSVDPVVAATLPVAGRTALRSVALGGALLGRRVLVTSAGGVGHLQVQLAALAGARVVVVSRRPEERTALLQAGAAEVVRQVADASGLFDLVLDGVGGRALASAVAAVAPGGTVVLLGATDPEPAPLTLLDFVGHEDAVVRSFFSYAQPAAAEDLEALVALVADGRLAPRVGLRADWRQTPSALDALADGRVRGKAVLTIDGGDRHEVASIRRAIWPATGTS